MNTKEQCRVKEVFLCRIFFESWLGSLPPEICISVQLYKQTFCCWFMEFGWEESDWSLSLEKPVLFHQLMVMYEMMQYFLPVLSLVIVAAKHFSGTSIVTVHSNFHMLTSINVFSLTEQFITQWTLSPLLFYQLGNFLNTIEDELTQSQAAAQLVPSVNLAK